jgi:hypothetical protein
VRLRPIRNENTGISVLGAVGAGSNAGPHFYVRDIRVESPARRLTSL